MIVFYAYTQFHIFNIINLKLSLHPDEKAMAFFVRPDDAKTKQYFKRLVDNRIVDSIIHFDSQWLNDNNIYLKLMTAPAVVLSIIKKNKEIKQIQFPEKVEKLYSYGSSVEMYLIYDHIRKTNNKNVQLICYEEGSGSYSRPANNQLGRLAKLVIGKILKINMPATFDKQLLYQPECIGIENVCALDAMPKIDRRAVLTYNNIFNYSDKGDYSRAVFFDGPDRDLDIQLRKIVMNIQYKDLSVKMHPRGVSRKYITDDVEFLYEGVQWEMVCVNHSAKNKILLAHYSTALFTPKAVYGDEPYLIFLFNLAEIRQMKDGEIGHNLKEYFEKFRKTYNHPERIFLPNNVPELIQIMKTIGNENE